MASAALATFLGPQINFPRDFNTNFLMFVRWIHFLAGITWIGLLYFFNLVNVPVMKELDATTKGKVMPALMTRALWWFRMSAVLTVLAGLIYWGKIVAVGRAEWRRLQRHRDGQLLPDLDDRLGQCSTPASSPARESSTKAHSWAWSTPWSSRSQPGSS